MLSLLYSYTFKLLYFKNAKENFIIDHPIIQNQILRNKTFFRDKIKPSKRKSGTNKASPEKP